MTVLQNPGSEPLYSAANLKCFHI